MRNLEGSLTNRLDQVEERILILGLKDKVEKFIHPNPRDS